MTAMKTSVAKGLSPIAGLATAPTPQPETAPIEAKSQTPLAPSESRAGWRRGWSSAPLASFAAKTQRLVHFVSRTAPAIAAVAMALSFGSGMAQAQTTGAALHSPTAVVMAVDQSQAAERSYIVKPGDNLSKIADRLNTTVEAILDINDIAYASLIFPDQVLKIPAEITDGQVASAQSAPSDQISHAHASAPSVEAPATYTVRPGDSLGRISQRLGVAVDALVQLNNISDPKLIHPGDVLVLRAPATQTAEVDPEPATTAAPTVNPHPEVVQPSADAAQGAQPAAEAVASGITHLSAEAQKVFTETQPALHWGMSGPTVTLLQDQLTRLNYPLGTSDGSFGGKTRSALRAFQAFNGLDTDGAVGPDTWAALASADSVPLPTDGSYAVKTVYRPYTADAYRLFLKAAADEGLPASWAIGDSLHKLLDSESDGEVGRPNYTYGRRANQPSSWGDIHAELQRGRITAKSSATGLGQLLLSNVERHYPSGRAGINVPLEEAAGMLSYIRERHRTPDNAWRRYNSVHEGY